MAVIRCEDCKKLFDATMPTSNCGCKKVGFRAIMPTSKAHAAVLEDLARRIDDE